MCLCIYTLPMYIYMYIYTYNPRRIENHIEKRMSTARPQLGFVFYLDFLLESKGVTCNLLESK